MKMKWLLECISSLHSLSIYQQNTYTQTSYLIINHSIQSSPIIQFLTWFWSYSLTILKTYSKILTHRYSIREGKWERNEIYPYYPIQLSILSYTSILFYSQSINLNQSHLRSYPPNQMKGEGTEVPSILLWDTLWSLFSDFRVFGWDIWSWDDNKVLKEWVEEVDREEEEDKKTLK